MDETDASVTPLQVLRVTWKPLVTTVTALEMMHPVAPVGVAGVEAEGGEDRVVGEERE